MTSKEKLRIAFEAIDKSIEDLQEIMNMLNYGYKQQGEIDYVRNNLITAKEALQEEAIEAQDCENCNGTGQVIADERIHGAIIDVPYKSCPECGGTGKKEPK